MLKKIRLGFTLCEGVDGSVRIGESLTWPS